MKLRVCIAATGEADFPEGYELHPFDIEVEEGKEEQALRRLVYCGASVISHLVNESDSSIEDLMNKAAKSIL